MMSNELHSVGLYATYLPLCLLHLDTKGHQTDRRLDKWPHSGKSRFTGG